MPSTTLITNQTEFLKEIMNKILPSSGNLYFLVGYFFFSGFQELYKNLYDKHLKILVGMDIEMDIQNKIKEFTLIETIENSRNSEPSLISIRDSFYNSFVRLCNDTDFFDSPEKEEAFKLYIEKIKNGSLEVKKTLLPTHAKLYLFENIPSHSHGGILPGTVITGSSNLSRAGLKDRIEVNVLLHDSRDYNEAKALFDSLWDKAVDIAVPHGWDTFEQDVVKKIWIDNEEQFKPFWLYIRVLDELFTTKQEARIKYPSEVSNQRYFNFKYQTDAIDSALSIINRHSGVIISDVVGLGKSIVASVIAFNLSLKTIIITPPHLKEQWESFRFEFDFNARVYSSGLIKNAIDENPPDQEMLIIIDEAHKYRNEATESYALLHRLCQGNKVVLLTATPYSNRPQDIFSMIKLFQVPAKSTIRTVENLSYEFKRLITEYKSIEKIRKAKSEPPQLIKQRIKNLADEIRNILSPLIIRRTRLDLEAIDTYRDDLNAQGIVFPKVQDPQSLQYPLGELAPLYIETLKQINPPDEKSGFIGARYKPVQYLKDFKKYREQITAQFGDEALFKQGQVNLAQFMRRLLVSRFESSIFAFKKTLNAMIQSSRNMLQWYEKAELVPIYKKGDIPEVEDLFDEESEQDMPGIDDLVFTQNIDKLKQKGYVFIPANELKVAFKQDITEDIKLLEMIQSRWFIDDVLPHDPKLAHFTEIVKGLLRCEPERKIIVYTHYADTANYLYQQLKSTFPVFKYTGSDASVENKRIIKENFDAGSPIQHNDYQILIATDAISEGYNLHRAGAIFNYDIPYNPTRVIQRVGRINRINKKMFDTLYIFNFFPTQIGEEEVRTKSISTLKKAMIDALLGDDTRVLTSEEELNSYFTTKMREEMDKQEELSWDTPYRQFFEKLKKVDYSIIENARRIPRRARIRREVPRKGGGVIIFAKKGDEYVFKLGENPIKVRTLTTAEALHYFEAEANEKSLKISSRFHDIYSFAKANLFVKHPLVAMDKGRQEAIAKVRLMMKQIPYKKDYLEDLLSVMMQLDALPEQVFRLIRRISFNTIQIDFDALEQAVPYSYLKAIHEKAMKIEAGQEFIIFAEEFTTKKEKDT